MLSSVLKRAARTEAEELMQAFFRHGIIHPSTTNMKIKGRRVEVNKVLIHINTK